MEQHLQNALSPNNELRKYSEEQIINYKNTNFIDFINMLTDIFTNNTNFTIASTAGLVIKNSIIANDEELQNIAADKWLLLNEQQRLNIKQILIDRMNNDNKNIRELSAHVLAGIAKIEVPKQLWPTFFNDIYNLVSINNYANLTSAAIFMLTYSCMYLIELNYNFIDQQTIIYNTIYSSINKSEEIKLQCIMALNVCLEIFNYLFQDIENYKRYLPFLAKHENEEIAEKALECITRSIQIYYNRFEPLLNELINYMLPFINNEEEIAIHAVEFFIILLETDKRILLYNHKYDLINLLIKKIDPEIDYNEDKWDISRAAVYCLRSLSNNLQINLFDIPEIENEIIKSFKSDDKTVGFVLTGCAADMPINKNDTKLLHVCKLITEITESKYDNLLFWCLSILAKSNCKLLYDIPNFHLIIEKAISRIEQMDNSLINACLFLQHLAKVERKAKKKVNYDKHLFPSSPEKSFNSKKYSEEYSDDSDNISIFPLSSYTKTIMLTFVNTINSTKYNQTDIRNVIFMTFPEIIRSCDSNAKMYLPQFLDHYILKIKEIVDKLENISDEYFLVVEDLLANYIVIVQHIILEYSERELKERRSDVLHTFIKLLAITKPSSISAEVYMSLSNILSPSSYFIIHISKLMPYIIKDLEGIYSPTPENRTESITASTLINFIGDLANILNQGFLKYSGMIIDRLITCINSNVSRDIKINILPVLGDIAMALGSSYTKYLNISCQMLCQIIELERKNDVLYVDELRHNTVEFIICLIVGLNNDRSLRSIIGLLVEVVKKIAIEDERHVCTKEIVEFVCDCTVSFGDAVNYDWVDAYLESIRGVDNEEVKEAVNKYYEMKKEKVEVLKG